MQTPQSRRAALKDLATVARDLTYPLVLKGEGIAHKTEAGAVAVGLPDEATLLDAARGMPTTRFLVEEMIVDTIAELLVGVVRDPAHGYVLTLAAGGILTELLVDSVNMTVPANRDQVRAGLSKLRIVRVLQGYRGRPAANIDAIIDAVMAVQSYVIAETPFEVEINPLLCGPTHAIAVDALITTGDPQ